MQMYGEEHSFLWFIELFPPIYCPIGPPNDILCSKQPAINQPYNDQAM